VCAEAFGGKSAVQVRACHSRDLPEVEAILQSSPEAAVWTADSLRHTFEQNQGYFLLGCQTKEIAGFISGRQVLEEGEILNLAVKPQARRGGIGKALLKALLEVFARENVLQVFLEVRESNESAIVFYQKSGFQQVGRRGGYYRDPPEAALLLVLCMSKTVSGVSVEPIDGTE
jgi:[ribosomal protein S18]-alanine N-acetyltransferase